MTKAIKQQKENTRLLDKDGLMEGIRANLESLWNANYSNPEATQAISEIFNQAQMMQQIIVHQEDLIANSMHLTELMQQQRDLALEDRDFWASQTKDEGKKALAWAIAWGETDISEQDVLRVIDVLIGDLDVAVSQYSRWDLVEAFRRMAREIAEEQMYLADAETPPLTPPQSIGEGNDDYEGDY